MEIEPYLEEYFFDDTDRIKPFRWNAVRDRLLP
jgi:5-methylcytosine-specific restriction protein B